MNASRLTLYAFDPVARKAWKFHPSVDWFTTHDNGHAVSIGFEVPKDISHSQLRQLSAAEVPYDEWNHSGCLSSCIRRGGTICRW